LIHAEGVYLPVVPEKEQYCELENGFAANVARRTLRKIPKQLLDIQVTQISTSS
jgi:hypothetical protein